MRPADIHASETIEVAARVHCNQPGLVLGENNEFLSGLLVTKFHGDNVTDVARTVVIPLAPSVKAAGFG